jgi:hypothetical protein
LNDESLFLGEVLLVSLPQLSDKEEDRLQNNRTRLRVVLSLPFVKALEANQHLMQ